MRKFAMRDVDADGEWDNGIVAFIIAPNEDRARPASSTTQAPAVRATRGDSAAQSMCGPETVAAAITCAPPPPST